MLIAACNKSVLHITDPLSIVIRVCIVIYISYNEVIPKLVFLYVIRHQQCVIVMLCDRP